MWYTLIVPKKEQKEVMRMRMITALECQCPKCRRTTVLYVFEDDYRRYIGGAKIQDCFSYLTDDQRELLLSGLCPDCWNELFGDEEEE